ncbi:uncharacterized protein [Dermacentor andersoni]|uniref:uncharacterized protein n=1 Tax=Dermacentor andersoni TaxID=34620 RepID=UPI0021550C88|nr:uncharacterized protein LOC126533791 [Dermacentor andersoni]
MVLLLLRSGDIESNPGPTTRSEVLLDVDSLPDDPSDQMKVMFQLLKEVHSRMLQTSKGQAEITADIKTIKNSQKNIESKLAGMHKRLDELEERATKFDSISQELSCLKKSMDQQRNRNDSLQSRLDEAEDRSRRDNLIFRGISDAKESWADTESKLLEALTEVVDSCSGTLIQRAHRLGIFSHKCRPVIAKFTESKMKEKILSLRNEFKSKGITISEDFSPATRLARQKLFEFGSTHAGPRSFKLRYNKLCFNNRCFMYNAITGTVDEVVTRGEHGVQGTVTGDTANGIVTRGEASGLHTESASQVVS